MGMFTSDKYHVDLQPESFISPFSEYGLLRSAGADRTVWLYANLPDGGPLLDGDTDRKRLQASNQLMAFFEGLAGQVSVTGVRYRWLLKSQYREFHILTACPPVRYHAPADKRDTPLGEWQNDAYRNTHVQQRLCVVGVPLHPGGYAAQSGHRRPSFKELTLDALNKIVYNLQNGAPMFEEYLDDAHDIERIMLAAGLEPFTIMDDHRREDIIQLMKTWWVPAAHSSVLPIIPEKDHIHLFPDSDTATAAEEAYAQNIPCTQWNLRGEYPCTICFAKSSDFSQTPVDKPSSLWAAQMMETFSAGGANAIGLSIRGKVEPAKVTEEQIRHNSNIIDKNIEDRREKGNEASGDLMEASEELMVKKSVYRSQGMPPTIIDTSVAAAVAGDAKTAMDALSTIPLVEFVGMNTPWEQLMGFKSMQACSPVRVTPYERHWSAPCITGSGLGAFAQAGDKWGALMGLTEGNRQPVYIGTTTVQDTSIKPFFVIVGEPGSGKTMCMLNLVFQWARTISRLDGRPTPVIYIDPKEDSDFSEPFLAMGGNVVSVDTDIADGTFDPFNVFQSKSEAKDTAAIMLADILSRGGSDPSLEITINAMIDYGIQHGAVCCGQAMAMAYKAYHEAKAGHGDEDASRLPDRTPEVFKHVQDLVSHNDYIRIIFGTRPDVKPLKTASTLTLIKAGKRSMVPPKDSANTVIGRVQRWVLRLIVTGAGAAIRGRDGVVCLDEAWVALGEGSGSVVEQWGRLARAQRFFPVLASQFVDEFIKAGLAGTISRGLILALNNPDETNGTVSEAKAALRLFAVDDSGGRIVSRMPLGAAKPNGRANYASLRPLKETDQQGRSRFVRGSVGYFKDGSNPPVPVEIVIPPKLLNEIRTDAGAMDTRRREATTQPTTTGRSHLGA